MNEAHVHTSAAQVSSSSLQKGLTFSRRFSTEDVSPYDEVQWERRTASITDSKGNIDLRAEGCGGAGRLVDDGDQHRGLEVPARPDGHAGARDRRTAAGAAAWRRRCATGVWRAATLPRPRMRPSSTTSWPHMLLTQKVAFNSPVWFNVGCDRLEPNSDGQNWHWDPATGGVKFSATGYQQSAVLGLLHQRGRRLAGLDPDPGQDRGHALQVGLGHGNQPVVDPRLDGTAVGRRHGLRPAQLHARLRRLCRRDQVAAARRAAPPRW